jgi:alcohol dehydrogenase
MKAAQISSYGGPEVMRTVNSATKPTAGPGEVLIAVRAAGLNPFDWKVREGAVKQDLPAILGGDVAGVVDEIGEAVSGFAVGDAVFGQANAVNGHGAFAEFTAVKAEQLADKPANVNFEEAAALPLAATSAYQALEEHINLQAGQKILIHGGAGGIGSFAVQIAKHLGAYVATTVSTDDLNFAKQLGADEVIDYKTQNFAAMVKNYDAVFDTVGGETNSQSYQVLKPGAVFVSMVAQPDEQAVKETGITYVHQASKATTERLNQVAKLVQQEALKVYIDKTFSLDQAAEALEYLKTGHPRGKVVLKVS